MARLQSIEDVVSLMALYLGGSVLASYSEMDEKTN